MKNFYLKNIVVNEHIFVHMYLQSKLSQVMA